MTQVAEEALHRPRQAARLLYRATTAQDIVDDAV